MKRIISLILVLCLAAVPVMSEETEPKIVRLAVVYIDKKIVPFQEIPYDVDGIAMVPIRPIAERLGFQLGWDGEKGVVTLASPDGEAAFTFTIGSATYDLNGKTLFMPVPVEVRNGITYIPANYFIPNLAQLTDKTIRYENVTTVFIDELPPLSESYELPNGVTVRMPEGTTVHPTTGEVIYSPEKFYSYGDSVPRELPTQTIVLHVNNSKYVSVGDLKRDAINYGYRILGDEYEQNGLSLLEIGYYDTVKSVDPSKTYLVCDGEGRLINVTIKVQLGCFSLDRANALIDEIISTLSVGEPSEEKF